jgi:hypothetical protein
MPSIRPLLDTTFEGERKCHGLDQYSSHLLLHLFFRFVLTWSSSIPLSPLLMPYIPWVYGLWVERWVWDVAWAPFLPVWHSRWTASGWAAACPRSFSVAATGDAAVGSDGWWVVCSSLWCTYRFSPFYSLGTTVQMSGGKVEFDFRGQSFMLPLSARQNG